MRVAYVRWLDSAITSDEEVTIDEAIGPIECESAGLLLEEGDESVTIALDHHAGLYRCTLSIPRFAILSIQTADPR